MRPVLGLIITLIIIISGCISQGGENLKLEGKKILMIIASENFRDEEYFHTKEVLEGYGAQIVTASSRAGEIKGMLGGSAIAEKTLDDVNVSDFDAVVFVGGTGAAEYFNNEKALSIARDAYNSGKVVGAICIAPSILANAGILENKNVTSFPSEKDNIQSKGGIYTGDQVSRDGRIITASGPAAARMFGEEIAKVLGGES